MGVGQVGRFSAAVCERCTFCAPGPDRGA